MKEPIKSPEIDEKYTEQFWVIPPPCHLVRRGDDWFVSIFHTVELKVALDDGMASRIVEALNRWREDLKKQHHIKEEQPE